MLTSTVVPVTLKVFPAPTKLSWVIPAPIWVPADWIPICEAPLNKVAVATPAIETLSRFVWPSTSNSTKSPSPLNVVAVMTPSFPNLILLPTSKKSSTSTPDLAVITPIESTFTTSS